MSMMRLRNLFALLMFVAVAGCTSAPTTPPKTDSIATPVALVDSPATSPIATPAAQSPVVIPANYDTLHNLEMVEYCLAYPADQFTENYKLAESKGQHVLLTKDKKCRITFSGNGLGSSWEELYHDCQAEIQEITKADPLVQKEGTDQFELSWKQDGKIIYMKKWHLTEYDESVTAKFEYPEAEAKMMDPIIATVCAQNPKCK
jgi:hypothetical protein